MPLVVSVGSETTNGDIFKRFVTFGIPFSFRGGMNSMVKSFKELMLDEEKDRPPVKMSSPRPAPSQPPSVMATSPPNSRKGGSAGDNVLRSEFFI